jgi:acetolactate synthase-1/2/3 large subunit
MCLGELATAVQYGCNITVIVFNDSALSMIGVKQTSTGYDSLGVSFSETDFAMTARGMGALGVNCARRADLDDAMREAFAHRGTSVLDIRVDPAGYHDQVKRLRG